MYSVVRQDQHGVTVIGPFDTKRDADNYCERRIELMKNNNLSGEMFFYVTPVVPPLSKLLHPEPEDKPCCHCEHIKEGT